MDYRRKGKEEKPVIAICYDFDKTLSPDDMQAQGFIQSIGYKVNEFWDKSNKLAYENSMDQNLAYMYLMIEEARGKVLFTKKTLFENGAKVKLFSGVEEWFERINNYAREKGVIIEHYIISSGLKEMIEGTTIAQKNVFEEIYACSFYYNEHGEAIWPSQVVNYTNKTQFLFRIEKGTVDINDPAVNDYYPSEAIRIPFRNIVYIGDSVTDIPCMKLVNSNGGHSIGVFNPDSDDKTKVYKMIRENRIKYFVPADYRESSELDILLKNIVDKTVAYEKLEEQHTVNRLEAKKDYDTKGKEEINKDELIDSLWDSFSFAYTHHIIEKMKDVSDWSITQAEKIFNIAVRNSQVGSIINDLDICAFYEKLLEQYPKVRYSDDVKIMLK